MIVEDDLSDDVTKDRSHMESKIGRDLLKF